MIRKVIIIIIILAIFSQGAFGEQLAMVDEALKKIYAKTARFERTVLALSEQQIRLIEEQTQVSFAGSHSRKIIIHKVFENDVWIGSAFEDTVIGKWGPIHYVVGLDAEGKILQVIVLDYEEIRGKPIAKRRFLKQYRGKSTGDPLKLRKDIDGVTGATISSRSITDGVRKIVHIFSFTD